MVTQRRPGAALSQGGLQALIDALRADGYRVVGPVVRDGAIVYDDVARVDEFPIGWTDRQEAGQYSLERRSDEAVFGFNVGPHTWKRFLHPPVQTLFTAVRESGDVPRDRNVAPASQRPSTRHGAGAGAEAPIPDTGTVSIVSGVEPSAPFAFIGVRGCELQAIAVQDRVFLGGAYEDRDYAERRRGAFIVALNCAQAGGTCFCVSTGTGPQAEGNFDLALTELPASASASTSAAAERCAFVVDVGSETGERLLARVPHRAATAEECASAHSVIAGAAQQMGRTLDTRGIRDLLQTHAEHPRWAEVAERCLSCGNCTMVCPTCFCTTVEDHSDLAGASFERVRKWDSCFTIDFSYVHGGAVRQTTQARYRQWMTHKLSSWIDQFGTMGCVGCGRCITWCPVGIDITEEAAAIRATAGTQEGEPHEGA